MSEDLIGYDQLTQEAMRSVMRQAMTTAAGPKGLPGRHHFYITFRTRAPGVAIPEHLLQRYSEEMTIVLEHQFWDLEVYPDHFRVILRFQGQPHPLTIPWSAVTRFYDPSVRFALHFDNANAAAQSADAAEAAQAMTLPPEEKRAAAPGAVVSLDAFRKK